jgi:hypothetical protein
MIARSLLVWCGLLTLAVANGTLRETVLTPRFGSGTAHVISSALLSTLIVVVGWFAMPWIGPATLQDAWVIGVTWVTLTVAFEFLGGHFLFGKPWKLLAADYNVLAGRIWIMVLIATFIAPILVYSWRADRPQMPAVTQR